MQRRRLGPRAGAGGGGRRRGRRPRTWSLAQRADVVVLCHKPAQLDAVAREIGSCREGIAPRRSSRCSPGRPGPPLRTAYPGRAGRAHDAQHARRGAPGRRLLDAPPPASTPAGGRRSARRFERLGTVVDVPEAQMELATAVMGVSPAYVALVAEAQVDAAVRHGPAGGAGAPPAVHRHPGRHRRAARRPRLRHAGRASRGHVARGRHGARSGALEARRAARGLRRRPDARSWDKEP